MTMAVIVMVTMITVMLLTAMVIMVIMMKTEEGITIAKTMIEVTKIMGMMSMFNDQTCT